MAVFRFRAAAALEARRRQEDDALAECTRKDGLKLAADQRCVDVARRRTEAAHALVDAETRGEDGATLAWHRNWISGLAGAAEVAARDAVLATDAVAVARRAWQDARKKRLVLERLRDRAWRRFQHDEARREQRVIDELARVRFTTRAMAEGSTS
jgi:flagellar export protein FliJ